MDDFQEIEDRPSKPMPGHPLNLGWVWDLFSLLLVAAACAVIVVVVLIFNNPASTINPFPPPTMVPTLFIPSLTPLPTRPAPTLPTSTSLPGPTATATPLPLPTQTAIAATPVEPGKPTPSATPHSIGLFSFGVQGEPRAIESSLFNPGRTCQWMGVAGQVFDLKNSPVPLGIIVQLAGSVNGKVLNITSLTGTATQYGPSGYEVTLADRTAASTGQLWIRLLNQEGIPLTDRVFFDTYSDCNKNLIIINFKQIK